MNSCILMAQITRSPELRYTQEKQTPVAEMLVEFPSIKAEEPPTTLKVTGWGNLATEIKDNYQSGDRVVIVGRLRMNTIDRPEGFREKRAELIASQVHRLDGEMPGTAPVPSMATPRASGGTRDEEADYAYAMERESADTAPPVSDQDLDDIPF